MKSHIIKLVIQSKAKFPVWVVKRDSFTGLLVGTCTLLKLVAFGSTHYELNAEIDHLQRMLFESLARCDKLREFILDMSWLWDGIERFPDPAEYREGGFTVDLPYEIHIPEEVEG